jgi:deoxyadenosine/deoxycytidine kinase
MVETAIEMSASSMDSGDEEKDFTSSSQPGSGKGTVINGEETFDKSLVGQFVVDTSKEMASTSRTVSKQGIDHEFLGSNSLQDPGYYTSDSGPDEDEIEPTESHSKEKRPRGRPRKNPIALPKAPRINKYGPNTPRPRQKHGTAPKLGTPEYKAYYKEYKRAYDQRIAAEREAKRREMGISPKPVKGTPEWLEALKKRQKIYYSRSGPKYRSKLLERRLAQGVVLNEEFANEQMNILELERKMEENRTIKAIRSTRRCSNCNKRHSKVCDRLFYEDKICTLCRNFSLTCECIDPRGLPERTPEVDENGRPLDEDLFQRLLIEYGKIPPKLAVERCTECHARRFRVCDLHISTDGTCSFCQNLKVSCIPRERKRTINRDSNSRRRPWDMTGQIRLMKRIPEMRFPKNKNVNDKRRGVLPDDLLLDTALLDSIHRAASHHTQIHEDHHDESYFKIFDTPALLTFGYLAEEIIREELQGFLDIDASECRLCKRGRFAELDITRRKGEDLGDVRERIPNWIHYANHPPVPPYAAAAAKSQSKVQHPKTVVRSVHSDSEEMESPSFFEYQDPDAFVEDLYDNFDDIEFPSNNDDDSKEDLR